MYAGLRESYTANTVSLIRTHFRHSAFSSPKKVHLDDSSRSSTDLSNFIRIVVLDGYAPVGVECAETLAGWTIILVRRIQISEKCIRTNPNPSKTASTIPAVSDEQLNCSMSFGTEI